MAPRVQAQVQTQAQVRAPLAHLVDTSEQQPEKALGDLDRFARALPFERESAFRRWAQEAGPAAEVVRRVDERRVAHVEELLLSKGVPSELARTLAWMEYSLLLGAASLRDVMPEEERRKMHRLVRNVSLRSDYV